MKRAANSPVSSARDGAAIPFSSTRAICGNRCSTAFRRRARNTVWESFAAFNSTGPKIEWRIEVDGERQVPIRRDPSLVCQRDPDDPEKKIEVLVVEKVGQIGVGEGCTVGLVVATGNPKANETARKIADEQAREFACGADERVIVSSDVELPTFDRQE